MSGGDRQKGREVTDREIDRNLQGADRQTGTCREVTVEMSLIRPSSSFRLYPSGRLSLSLTFHSLMVLSGEDKPWGLHTEGKGKIMLICCDRGYRL